MKFKKGDTITRMEYCSGFERAIVLDIFEDKGRQYYKLKILNGTSTMPVVAEVNYERLKK